MIRSGCININIDNVFEISRSDIMPYIGRGLLGATVPAEISMDILCTTASFSCFSHARFCPPPRTQVPRYKSHPFPTHSSILYTHYVPSPHHPIMSSYSSKPSETSRMLSKKRKEQLMTLKQFAEFTPEHAKTWTCLICYSMYDFIPGTNSGKMCVPATLDHALFLSLFGKHPRCLAGFR